MGKGWVSHKFAFKVNDGETRTDRIWNELFKEITQVIEASGKCKNKYYVGTVT